MRSHRVPRRDADFVNKVPECFSVRLVKAPNDRSLASPRRTHLVMPVTSTQAAAVVDGRVPVVRREQYVRDPSTPSYWRTPGAWSTASPRPRAAGTSPRSGCAVPSAPPDWSAASPRATCRSRCATPIPAPPGCTTWPGQQGPARQPPRHLLPRWHHRLMAGRAWRVRPVGREMRSGS